MKTFAFLGALLALWVVAVGCGQSPTNSISSDSEKTSTAHSHESWWCREHGVPEEICAQCHPKVAKQYKAKGDWCQQHDRPESQCFICHPELESKFATLYEAKYGNKPPKPEAN